MIFNLFISESENHTNVGALLFGFFDYYSKFDFHENGILIRDAAAIKMQVLHFKLLIFYRDYPYKPFKGLLNSMIFVEEPYDGLTVPKNVKKAEDFDYITKQFKVARDVLDPKKHGGQIDLEFLMKLRTEQND
jgi:hypothetical protein